MISPNIGDLVASALRSRKPVHKAGIWEVRYTVGDCWAANYKGLIDETRVLDRGGYKAALFRNSIHQPNSVDYRLRPTTTELPASLIDISKDSYPSIGAKGRAGSVLELLLFLVDHAKAARAILRGGHRILFFGDVGIGSGTCVGVLSLELRRFCIRRIPVDSVLEGHVGEYVLFERIPHHRNR